MAVNATVLKQLVVIGTNAKVTKEHDGNTFKVTKFLLNRNWLYLMYKEVVHYHSFAIVS